MSCVLVKMLHILVLCPVLLIGGVQTLTIDSQLGTSIEDCFERISIGEQLPSDAIYRNVTELTTTECEQICKQDKQCQTYDYGVGAKGNATCELSTHSEKEVKEGSLLSRHPDYDVFARRLQCEQAPPRPILADDVEGPASNDRPQHRPVFRPDVDDRPLTGDYLVSSDIDPYNLGSKPQSYRPDDISQRPDFDIGPSYGDHKPQDMSYPERPRPDPYRPNDSYRPEKDPYRPNYDSYRPNRPQDSYKPNRPLDSNRPQSDQYQKPKPESNDVLHFGYEKPIDKPDPYRPERPNYNYIIRPNRKPRPSDDYMKPNDAYSLSYKPGKPTYSYNSQYASNYGQNQNDNSIYVEIYDPPRPYVPIKDRPIQHDYDQGFLGYGTYSSQNSYTHNQNAQSSYTGSITEIYDKPQKPYDKPNRPNQYGQNDQDGYNQRPNRPNDKYKPQGNQNSYGTQNSYNSNQQYQESYGSQSQSQSSYGENRPYERPPKPSYNKPSYNDDKGDYSNQGSYGSGQNYGSQSNYNSFQGQGSYSQDQSYNSQSYGNQDYGSQGYGGHGGNQATYGGNQASYGGNHGSYGYGAHGSYSSSGYGNRPVFDYETHKPRYGNENPAYNHQKPSYGSSKPDYDSPRPGYGQKPESDSTKPGYDSPRPGYDSLKPGYDSLRPGYGQKPGYDSPSPGYDSARPGYDSSRPGNDSPRPDYGQKPEYDSPKPGYDSPRPGYGQSPDYDSPKPGYDSARPGYVQTPEYDSQRPEYDSPRPGYGQKPEYDTPKPGYGSSSSGYDNQKPGYDSSKPGYDSTRPGYGQKPEYDSPRPGYGQKPDYNIPKPGYGTSKPEYDPKPGYGSSKPDNPTPGYGSEKPGHSPKPGYGNERPDPDYERPGNQKPGYGNDKPDDIGYGPGQNVKPVYEYELDKPTNVPAYIARPGGEIVTSRPVVIGDYERPVYKQPGSSYAACFRRVLAGRRALRSFVRKVVPCERLEDCRRECALEKRFHCESFNYRLDQSFRGKGLCELMTKPIEAFDQQRDFVDDKNYDFYEVDRNSLEPNCPETLHGPGSLHSGFLSSKPDFDRRIDQRVDLRPNRVDQRPNRIDQSGWRDRHDWAGGYRVSYDDRRFYEDRRQGNRRYEEHFVPYQIGQARSDDDNSWGQYGGSYGGQYYKDRNDYHKSMTHWGLSRHSDRKSHDFDYHSLGKNLDIGLTRNDFHNIRIDKGSGYGYGSWKRGRWNSSGVPSGFNGIEGREGSDENQGHNECYARRRPGMSLKSGAIRRSLIAQNVVECETACFTEREFKCVSYSFRYSTSRGTDNCFLSERPYRGLEMSADTASDVYAMPQDKCATSSRPWVESECFWHVRSDTSVSGTAVKATLTVAGLGACEAECIRAHGFFCRGFSFRFDSPTIGDEDIHNCILTSSPTTKLSRSDTSGHELYARGNYGRGCEPAVYDDTHNGECYLQYDKAARLTGAAIRGQARVKDEQTCGIACTEAPFRCLSFSYNNNASPSSDNCLLSEIRLFDLQRGLDYVHSEDDWLFAFDLFNSKCWRKLHNEDHTSELPHPILPVDHEHFHVPSGPSGPGYPDQQPELPYIPESGPSGPSGPTGPIGPYGPTYEIDQPDKTYPIEPFKPSRPERPNFRPEPEIYRPGFRPPESKNPNFQPPEIVIPYKPEYPDPEPYPESRPFRPEGFRPETGFRPESFRPELSGPRPERPFRPTVVYPKPDLGFKPGLKPAVPGYLPGQQPQRPVYQGDIENGPMEASWRHYTVSGFPCRAGTKCAQNLIVGHWACEPEGGEIGSWDYCCAPTHRCGYSEGFHKPWCYVGQKQDQWRPCSEKYYPYHHHKTPHPSQGIRDPPRPRPWRDTPNTPNIPNSPWPVKATPPPHYTPHWDKPPGPYLSEADKMYWDRLYEDGPKAYYDKHGNPLPGYSRVPTEDRPYIRYKHNNGPPASGHWVPVADGPPVPGLGAPRYWPVAYLHRGPPPNITYFRYNERKPTTEHDTARNPPKDRAEGRNDDDGINLEDDRSRSNGHSNGDSNNDDYRRNNHDSRRYDSRDNDNDYRRNDARRHNDTNYNNDYRRNNDDSRGHDDGRRNNDARRNDDSDNDNKNNDESRRNYDSSRRDHGSRRNNNSRGNVDRGNDDFRPNNDNPRRNDDDDYGRDERNENDSREDNDYRDNSRNSDSSRRNNDSNDSRNDRPKNGKRDEETARDDKKIDDGSDDSINSNVDKPTKKITTTETPIVKENKSDVELVKTVDFKTKDSLKGIDDKLDDFSKSIEVLDIEEAKVEKLSDLKTLEAEERQIEAIGRLLANRRGSQIVLEKRSQKDLDTKSIAIDKDLDYNFGNRFPERRGVIKRISKDEIERDRNDKSLEVSETTFVRPPRVLSTTDNIRKAVVNGKIFYDATLKDTRDIFSNNTRKPKNLRRSENTTPSVINNNNFGKKKVIRNRNTNPVRRVKRVYRKRYNPEEVRRRLLERDRSKNSTGKSL